MLMQVIYIFKHVAINAPGNSYIVDEAENTSSDWMQGGRQYFDAPQVNDIFA